MLMSSSADQKEVKKIETMSPAVNNVERDIIVDSELELWAKSTKVIVTEFYPILQFVDRI